jgi:predicted O-methyltransferase YrrM
VSALLTELERSGRKNDEHQIEYGRRMMNLDPATASLVNLILRSTHRKAVLEIGTSNGYSTTWIAAAMKETGGRVVSVDRSPEKHHLAEENLKRAGLSEFVEIQSGNATELARKLPGPFDCIFFDADRHSAPEQLELLLPKLTREVLLLADNALSHPDEIAAYLTAVTALPEFDSIIVPVGKGLSFAYRAGGARAGVV